MRALVTGASGFLGSCLTRALVGRGWQVAVLRLPGAPWDSLAGLPVTHYVGDVTEPASLAPAVRGVDAVFHLAAAVTFWRGTRSVQERVNVEGTRNVVAAALAAGVRRLVHTSSVAAIGVPAAGTVGDEGLAWNADALDVGYMVTKHRAELEARAGVARGLDAVMVNPGIVFGPGDRYRSSAWLMEDLARGRLPVYTEGGSAVVDVADVVAGEIAAFERGRPGERYILAGGNMTYRELLGAFARALGVRPPRLALPAPMARLVAAAGEGWSRLVTGRQPLLTRDQAVMGALSLFFDGSKAARELGLRWTPFAETVGRTVAWLRAEGTV